MNKQLKGFMDFVRSQGVVGLAVGLAIGTQAGKAVEAIVHGLINPIVSFIVGDTKGLENAKWEVIKSSTGGRTLTFGWGEVVSALITLVAVSLVIYYIVSGLKLDKLDKK
jgi:large-conductance mechanosensitive channel